MGQKILIVDDEPDLVETCARVLGRRGYQCVFAHTGREGIDLLELEHPDLVLTDLALPDIDGLSVLRAAREQASPIPGILMTAYTSSTSSSNAFAAGATFFLAKPFSTVALLDVVARALNTDLQLPAPP